MEFPAGLYVRPLQEDADIFAFQFPFDIEAKALDDGTDASVISELDDGDLIIEGFAAEFEGNDRQGENFTDGAFQRGIKSFLSGPASLCFHHKHEKVLGKVLELEEVEGKGLRMKARVDGAIKTHPELGTIYSQIKNGTLSALSVGGFFKRKLTAAGRKISDMDFTEISITPVPVHAKPSFAVVAGKALEDPSESVDSVLEKLSVVLNSFEAALPECKAVKGDPEDLYFLATLLRLEQQTNSLTTKKESEFGSASDDRVDALVVRVKNYLDGISREAHSLAADLGPLPQINAY